MRIIIDYESSWRNSFLDGDNNEPLPPKGRKFVGSMTNLKKPENFKNRQVTLDTVMGLLNRFIGDQRKLYQSRGGESYFFADIDYLGTEKVMFEDRSIETREMTFIRNITGSTDQNSFTGSIKTSDTMFQSDYSEEFWGILALDFEPLCQFIVGTESRVQTVIEMDPISILSKLEVINKEKPVENKGLAGRVLEVLHQQFPEIEYLNKKDMIMPISLYCSALYLQLDRLEKRDFDMESAKTKAGGISGISKRGFTAKDFMNRFTTGDKKKIWGNPYIRKERKKGVGEITSLMTKASGQLEINLDVSRDKAKEIKGMIERAGVSSFYLGKKGLAYISQEIDTRELR
ncbi:MAG: hypothetical protein KUG80_08955 [Gammaproteobacteria bacterium]|nr:hypothetical protein [Gammaproteobacteria bacterium]